MGIILALEGYATVNKGEMVYRCRELIIHPFIYSVIESSAYRIQTKANGNTHRDGVHKVSVVLLLCVEFRT